VHPYGTTKEKEEKAVDEDKERIPGGVICIFMSRPSDLNAAMPQASNMDGGCERICGTITANSGHCGHASLNLRTS
jgi:hypothetical protein